MADTRQTELIAELTALLAGAKRGEVIGLASVVHYSDQTFDYFATAEALRDGPRTLGALGLLRAEIEEAWRAKHKKTAT